MQKYLRKKHNIDVYITPIKDCTGYKIKDITDIIPEDKCIKKYLWDIYEQDELNNCDENDNLIFYNSYEEALEEGLYQGLLLI